jgi:hypothetical protein
VRGALAIALCAASCGHHPAGVTVASAVDLGAVSDAAAANLWRDGGSSVLLGAKVLWSFGDTIFPFKADDGSQLRTNTAALAAPDAPLAVSEPLDGKGAPAQFVPFTSDETAVNASIGPGERIALWPGAMINTDADHALVFVDKLRIHPGYLNYEALSSELALAATGSTSAQRLGALFTVPEPQFVHAAVAKDGAIFLYACETSGACRVARAPLSSATQRSAYQFWTGSGWSSDVSHAKLDVPGSTSGFSVAWNEAMGKFVSATSPGFSNQVFLRTSPAPEGPWSDAVLAWTAPSAIYAVYQHPELQLDGGRRIRISYSRPTGNFAGEIRLIEVALR